MTAEVGQLAAVVEELIAVLQLQAQELEKLITRVEQVTTHLPEANELSTVRSELAALHVRVKKFRAGQEAGP
jgi:chaperonin cofactor prefoldin